MRYEVQRAAAVLAHKINAVKRPILIVEEVVSVEGLWWCATSRVWQLIGIPQRAMTSLDRGGRLWIEAN